MKKRQEKRDLKVEALTVCVDYSADLEHCLDNRRHFDRWIVVTTPEDERTLKLCRAHGLEARVSTRIRSDGAPFNKGKGLNDGLAVVSPGAWVACIDADVLLPDEFRHALEWSRLDPRAIYTCKYRALCPDGAALARLKEELYDRPLRSRLGPLRHLSRKLFGRRRTRRWFGPLADKVIERYPLLTDAVVMDEIRRRSAYCLAQGLEDSRWRDASLTHDEMVWLKRQWLARHADQNCFERNDFKAGFVQVFHSGGGERFSEEFPTAGMVDTEFFSRFRRDQDEGATYRGAITRFAVADWHYLTVPKGLRGHSLHYLLCFHLGLPYTHWSGRRG